MKNQREIKVRAWDKFSQTMHHNVLTDGKKVIAKYNVVGGEDPLIEPSVYSLGEPNMFQLSEFTGLTDFFDKDIYNGDVVMLIATGEKAEVVFLQRNCQYWLCFQNMNFRELMPTIWEKNNKAHNLKVIGNIYQDPELKCLIDYDPLPTIE